MSEKPMIATGEITHAFGHRFVLNSKDGPLLVDLTPKGLEQIALRIGDHVTVEGEMKPSELKVTRLTCDGKTIHIRHQEKDHHKNHPHADPKPAIAAARAAGYEPVGEPRRKPKHFEVLGRRGGQLTELHIELDGHIRKSKPVFSDDPKWDLHRASSPA